MKETNEAIQNNIKIEAKSDEEEEIIRIPLIHKNHDEFEHLESRLNLKESLNSKLNAPNLEGPENDTNASKEHEEEVPKEDQPLTENKVRTSRLASLKIDIKAANLIENPGPYQPLE